MCDCVTTLPFYRESAEMITKHTLLLLVVLLPVNLSHGLSVVQPESRLVNADGSVTIACELRNWTGVFSEMQVALKWKHNNTATCEVLVKTEGISNYNPDCVLRRNPPNHFLFTLFHLYMKRGDAELYMCDFTMMIPPPVQTFQGNGTKLLFPEAEPAPVTSAPTVMQCPEPGLLNWMNLILMGLAVFLLLSCLMVTCAYIRLRGKRSKDDDSLTYVPMQRRGDPESNTTYMDMRKMQLGGRTSGRDMNYNSHQITY
ncbi:hypothetical protein AAFF_G00045040 [Aldrovandia affinis]|uniref:Uncharacterized protein n=1 Tax=Aldrovandia affinis TaxID=143900 RepID=A0AAD7S1X6_9TELE|nr:hypothetical protein AAFF_G00045040 [Aldrovandia affinis]